MLLDWFPFTSGSDLRLLASIKKTLLLLCRPQNSTVNITRKIWFIGVKFSEKSNRSICFQHSKENIFLAFGQMPPSLKKIRKERRYIFATGLRILKAFTLMWKWNVYEINHMRTAEMKANEEWLPPCSCERNLCFMQLRKNVFSMMVDFSKLTLTRKISFPFKPLVNLPTMADVVVWKQ